MIMVDHSNCRCAIVSVKEEPKMFDINWQRDNDVLALDLVSRYECIDVWVMRTHTNRFTNGSVCVPVGYWEIETIGM